LPSGSAVAPREHVALQPFSTLGVGGPARWFISAERMEDVANAHRWADERRVPMFVLGGGSNLVIADEGFNGLVIHVALMGVDRTPRSTDTLLAAGAGESWDRLVETAVTGGLAGIECLSGIPGTVGGTPIQNVGAYGQDVSQTIDRVIVYDMLERRTRSLPAADCGFSYRMSRFKAADAGRFVVCGVAFRLRQGPPTTTYADVDAYLKRKQISAPTLADVRRAVLDIRRAKGMVIDAADMDSRSVGSFFMNPVVPIDVRDRVAAATGETVPGYASGGSHIKIPAAWLIERAGFNKGYDGGTVAISTKHPLAIVNRGGATARDIVRFASKVKRGVAERFGVWLRPEPVFVGFSTDPDVAYLKRTGL
jgi:UDP-N-acetylmuramate dehydrogenase